jgi:protein tyrosine/serine phosphatase
MTLTWICVIGLFLLLAGAYAWWHYVEHRLTVITPGEAYTSGAMPPETLKKVVKKYGIRTVFDLRCPDEGEEKIEAEKKALEEVGVHAVNLQSSQVPPDDIRDRFIAWIADPEHRPALMHCNHGEGRAVLYGALWRIEFEGMDPEKARKKCRMLTTRGSSFDPRKVKGAYLRNYRSGKKI